MGKKIIMTDSYLSMYTKNVVNVSPLINKVNVMPKSVGYVMTFNVACASQFIGQRNV